jgi:hypothetical protein
MPHPFSLQLLDADLQLASKGKCRSGGHLQAGFDAVLVRPGLRCVVLVPPNASKLSPFTGPMVESCAECSTSYVQGTDTMVKSSKGRTDWSRPVDPQAPPYYTHMLSLCFWDYRIESSPDRQTRGQGMHPLLEVWRWKIKLCSISTPLLLISIPLPLVIIWGWTGHPPVG